MTTATRRRLPGFLPIAALIGVCAIAAPATAAPWSPNVAAARAYAQRRAGHVNFAVRTPHRTWGLRAIEPMRSASVIKAMLLVAYLDDPRVRFRPLRAADRKLIDPMVRRSDNVAASAVLAFVGPARVRAVARMAGMRRFVLGRVTWGASRIDAGDQTRFFLHIDRYVVARHRATAMALLASIVPSQRWGIGRVPLRGWRLYFKGGWGSGTGAVAHQAALLRRGSRRVSVAVLTSGSPSHEYATETLRGVFARLLGRLNATPTSSGR